MKPIGHKRAVHNVFGGKNVNRGLKFGAKALGFVGDLAVPAAFLAPAAVPALEAAKAASVGMDIIRKGRQAVKYRSLNQL